MRTLVPACLIVMALVSVLGMPEIHSYTSFNPRSVSPYGYTLNTPYGTVIPTQHDNMSSWGICAQKPTTTSVLGIPCNNGTTNGTIVFNVTGFELTVQSYLFTVTTYGNGTLQYVFIGAQPNFVQATTIVQSATYFAGNEKILTTSAGSDLLCLSYVGNFCTGTNGGGSGGGGSGGGGGGGASVCVSCLVQPSGITSLLGLLIVVSFGFLVAAAVVSRRRKRGR